MKKISNFSLIFLMLVATAFFATCANPGGPEDTGVVWTTPAAITSVALSIVEPAFDQIPATTATTSGNYTVTNVSWTPSNNPFAANTEYTVTITVQANANFAFNDSTTATINGNTATFVRTGNTAAISFLFPQTGNTPVTNITSINITGLVAPVTGATPGTSFTYNSGAGFTAGTLTWSPNHDPFQSGQIYTATITLNADQNYQFVDIATVTHNAGTLQSVTHTGSALTVTLTFPKTLVHLASVNVGITAPVGGAVPSTTATVASGSGFTSGTVTWSPANNPFTAPQVYTVTVTLYAESGYAFVGLVQAGATINGEAVTTFAEVSGTEVILTRTFPATAALPTLILTPASVDINDGALTATVNVGGTAAGTVTLDTSALPAGVTASVTGTTITVTGVRPASDQSAITGTYAVVVTRGGLNETLTVNLNLTPLAATPTLTLTPASVDINDGALTATVNVGGTAAGTVTLDTSALPAGVTASVTGTTITVTGVRPASDQSAITGGPFSVTVTRENITQTFTVSVNLTPLPPPLEITTSVLPDGTANMVYPAQTLAATGDTPITWSVTGGSLPGGLSLNANTGVITGTPTAAGTFIFTVTAANAGNTATQELTIRVLPGATPPRITTEALPGGVVGQEYSQALVASGTAPITWSHSGSLPPGITRTGGVLSGTPTAAGTFTFTATASGTGTPPTHSRTFTIVITNVAQPPQIVSNEATMGSGTQGRGFSYTLEARGTAPFTWSHTGSLPPGMSFNDGVISGTPTAAGTHSFTVTATNDAGTHSGTLNLTIHPALVLGPGGVVYGFPGLTFTVVNGRLQVNGTYTGNSTNLIFPSEIGGIPLGNFTNHNFADNMDLQTVTIPSGVTIHVQTFAGANNLHTIIIGSNVTFSGNGTGGIIGPGGTPSTNFRDIYLSYGSQPGIFIRNTTTHVWSRQP